MRWYNHERIHSTIDYMTPIEREVGTIMRDGYAGYAHLTDALHAWCGAHLGELVA